MGGAQLVLFVLLAAVVVSLLTVGLVRPEDVGGFATNMARLGKMLGDSIAGVIGGWM